MYAGVCSPLGTCAHMHCAYANVPSHQFSHYILFFSSRNTAHISVCAHAHAKYLGCRFLTRIVRRRWLDRHIEAERVRLEQHLPVHESAHIFSSREKKPGRRCGLELGGGRRGGTTGPHRHMPGHMSIHKPRIEPAIHGCSVGN